MQLGTDFVWNRFEITPDVQYIGSNYFQFRELILYQYLIGE